MALRLRIYYNAAQKAKMWDRGKELADHQRFTLETGYFTALIMYKNINCLRIYGFLLRKLPSSL